MTRKELILRMIGKLPDDVTYDRVIYHLDVMRDIEISLEQAERGEVIDHDDLFAELLREDEQDSTRLVRTGKGKPPGNSGAHRGRRAAKGEKVREETPRRSRATKKVS